MAQAAKATKRAHRAEMSTYANPSQACIKLKSDTARVAKGAALSLGSCCVVFDAAVCQESPESIHDQQVACVYTLSKSNWQLPLQYYLKSLMMVVLFAVSVMMCLSMFCKHS